MKMFSAVWQPFYPGQIWVNIGLDNDLLQLQNGNKPLSEPALKYCQISLLAFTWGQFHSKRSRYEFDSY